VIAPGIVRVRIEDVELAYSADVSAGSTPHVLPSEHDPGNALWISSFAWSEKQGPAMSSALALEQYGVGRLAREASERYLTIEPAGPCRQRFRARHGGIACCLHSRYTQILGLSSNSKQELPASASRFPLERARRGE